MTLAPNSANQLGEKNLVEPFDNQEVLLSPTPQPKIDLHDAHAIRREMARLYRDMRNGHISTQDGTRLAYVLDMVRKAHDTAILQDRLELLERTLKHRN